MVELAHGVGRVYEAPLPVWLYAVGAAVTVLLSFILRALVRGDPKERAPVTLLGDRGAGILVAILRVGGVAALALTLIAGVVVRDKGLGLTPLLFWLGLVIGTAALSAAIDGVWDAADPWRTIESAYRLEAPVATSTPPWWVGPVGLYALFWFELISGVGFDALAIVVVLVGYSLFVFTFRARWGDAWRESDPLSVLFGFAGMCAPLTLDREGLRYRGWLTALDRPELMSKAAFTSVFVLLSATTLDNVRETTAWHSFLASTRADELPGVLGDSLALIAFALVFLLPFALAMWVARASARDGEGLLATMRAYGWSLVPIGIAYLLAHNAPLLMTGAPRVIEYLSDPFEMGWNLFGTAGAFHTYLPSPALVWFIEIALVIEGHVLGVLSAHRIAVRRARDHVAAVRSQVALTVLMSFFTIATLVLLGQPLVA